MRLSRYVMNLVVTIAATVVLTACATAAPVKIVCLGDSITNAVRAGVTQEQSFEALLENWLSERVVTVKVINEGIGGEKTNQALARLAKDVVARKPDYVTIMYGTNDSAVNKGASQPRLPLETYEKNLRLIVQRLRAAGISPVLMTSPPLGNSFSYVEWAPYKEDGPNCMLIDYVRAVRRVAREDSVPLVDNFARWAETEYLGTDIDTLMGDGCHPNPAGHKLVAQTMYPVLAALLGGDQEPPGVLPKPTVKPQPQVTQPAQPGENLALNKPYAETSHNDRGNWAIGLTDGVNNSDESGAYATWTEEEYPKLTTIDLGASCQVGRVLLYNLTEGPTKNVVVSISADNQTFTEVGKHQFAQGDGAVYEAKFEPIQARYIRISFLDNYPVDFHGNENFMVLREVEVFSE